MSDSCKQPMCDRPIGKALGYCNAHYARQRLGRRMDTPIANTHLTDTERFWAKVEKSNACWMWTGATENGYGLFRLESRARLAHRVSFMWAFGPITPGAEVDHMCFNRACVKPSHLRVLTHQQNGQNRASANRNSKSGIRGVYWNKDRKGWMAAAYIRDDIHRFGPFETAAEAEMAIVEFRRQHMPASINDQRQVAP